MNKYQEALDNLIRVSCPRKVSCKECDFEKLCNSQAKGYIDTIQELVERATPKKPKQTVYNAFCPNCKQALGRQFAIDDIQGIMCRQYCPNCGQKILWEDE